MLRFQGKEELTANNFSDLFFLISLFSLISAEDFEANFHGLAFSKYSNFNFKLPFKLERKYLADHRATSV